MLDKLFLPFTMFMLVTIFLIAKGCGGNEMSYHHVGVGVSSSTIAYLQGEKLDLSSELDPSQIPEIVKMAYLESAELKKEGKDQLAFVIQRVSQKISDISSIDLDQNQIPDPILVVPEGDKEQMTFSIRVPDPQQVKTYPNDPNSWQNIAESKSIEVLSVSVIPRLKGEQVERMDVEARPNEQVYENHHHHHYHSSFMHNYFTFRLLESLFFNPFYGGWYGPGFYARTGYYSNGYYQDHYSNRSVQQTKVSRKSYARSPASTTPLTTNTGKTVSSKLSNQKSSSVSSFKSSAIQKRNSSLAARKATGFGKTSSSKSSSSFWGRSPSRSSWGGGGSRSFGK